jgi:ribosome biogenesis GTPase
MNANAPSSDPLDASFEPSFEDFGELPAPAREFLARHAVLEGSEIGRVVRLDRGYPLVVCQSGSYRSEHAISLVKTADMRACVGDWVILRLPSGHDKALIETILPRVRELSRWDGKPQGLRQTLAANIDLVAVVQPLSKRTILVDRIVRSAVLACQGHMRIAVILTKADRADAVALEKSVALIRTCLGKDVPVIVTSVREGRGIDQAKELVPPKTSAVLLGESGAGKSSLINALLGAEVLGTGEVRRRDDAGRHTTVARRMLRIPEGGIIVDAPGLRSLPLLDERAGLEEAFPDIASLVPACKFRDCSHGDEPGCAVRAQVRAGAIPAARLDQYRALEAEMRANRLRLDRSAPQSITV